MSACLLCHHDLDADELERVACRRCQTRLAAQLGELSALYRALAEHLAPSAGARGPAVSGTPDPGMPVTEAVLELRAWSGMVDALRAHEDDWRRALRLPVAPWRGTVEQTLTACAQWLGAHLWWACEKYPDVDGLAEDVRRLHGAASSIVDPDPGGRGTRAGWCTAPTAEGGPCGALLRLREGETVVTCPWCGTVYPPASWLALKAAMGEAEANACI
ncbi:hypothetical protein [Streptomyces sp. NPDC050560]|uniref:hypothetical protein n=1 Tax=Streptomyces sp. NPDC050560 TaxID=3365630 RepID=UPI0037A9B95E